MNVLIKDMGKPKSCYVVIDGEYEYCPFVNTDDDCVLLLKKGTCEGTWADQYSKCPLIEAPELCEDAVSRQAAIEVVKHAWAKGLEPTQYLEELPAVQPQPEEDCDTCKHGYFGDRQCDNCRVRFPSHYEREEEHHEG